MKRTLDRGRVLEPFSVRPDLWFYVNRSRLEVEHQLDGGGHVSIRLPMGKLVEALEALGYAVKPPRSR